MVAIINLTFTIMKKKTTMRESVLPKEKKDLFSNKLDSMPARDALNVLYNHYGYKHLLSEECYNDAVENGLIEKLW